MKRASGFGADLQVPAVEPERRLCNTSGVSQVPVKPLPRPRFDTLRAARLARRAMLPAVLLSAMVLYWCFGVMRVNSAMDTLPDKVPPGSLCVIDKRQSAAGVGDAVFVEAPGGGILLSRVTARGDDGSLTLRNDNSQARFPDSDDFGPVPASALRGTVRVVFPPDRPELPAHGK